MYSRQEASRTRKDFWTSFGLYMRPVKSADGESVNWLNYKTGIKDVYFRMDADAHHASIGIELRHADPELQQYYFEQLKGLEKILQSETGEPWEWKLHERDDDGKIVTIIGTRLNTVNIFNKEDWHLVISFLKPRIMALDRFWDMVKEGLQ